MGDVLSALLPPAVVATVFCTFVIKLLRKEMAPRTSDGRLVKQPAAASGPEAAGSETAPRSEIDAVTAEGGTEGTPDPSTEVSECEPGSGDR